MGHIFQDGVSLQVGHIFQDECVSFEEKFQVLEGSAFDMCCFHYSTLTQLNPTHPLAKEASAPLSWASEPPFLAPFSI